MVFPCSNIYGSRLPPSPLPLPFSLLLLLLLLPRPLLSSFFSIRSYVSDYISSSTKCTSVEEILPLPRSMVVSTGPGEFRERCRGPYRIRLNFLDSPDSCSEDGPLWTRHPRFGNRFSPCPRNSVPLEATTNFESFHPLRHSRYPETTSRGI